ncbi:MAG: hypothetical protein AAFY15_04095, partial [Cyanobacteria bacterium J06648_11]
VLRENLESTEKCPRLSSEDVETLHPRTARDRIARELNCAIDHWQDWVSFECSFGERFDSVFVSRSYGRSCARAHIDELLGEGRLIPGARLELADGLWKPAQVAACFPPGWSGVCDFVACTSEYLTDEVKSRRSTAVFRADSRCLLPRLVLSALSEAIPRLRRELHARDQLAAVYMDIAYELDHKYGAIAS